MRVRRPHVVPLTARESAGRKVKGAFGYVCVSLEVRHENRYTVGMQQSLAALLGEYKTISIVGICKNAGKTTTLGRLIDACRGERLGLSSIGRDGEAKDVATGTDKPPVRVPAGTVFATAERLIPLCTVTRTVLALSDIVTPLGRVAVLRAESEGQVQIAGPSTVEQMQQIALDMRAFGAERVLIDGAIFRRSIANPRLCDAVILAVGAAYHADMARVVNDAGFLCDIMSLPLYDGEAEARFFDGALTDATAEQLAREAPCPLVLLDPSRALLGEAAYRRLARHGTVLYVREKPALLFVSANPYSPYGAGFSGAAFIEALSARLPVPVLDAKEAI